MIQVDVTTQNPVTVGVSGSLVQIPGPSAYEVAVANGYTGTQAQWLASLVGPTGAQGAAGANGVSPAVTVTAITGGHRVTVTDAAGSSSFDVLDGLDGTGTGDMCQQVYSPGYTGELASKTALDALTSTVNGHTAALGGHSVAKDVPSDALFTDTVYDDTALAGRATTIEEKIPAQATAGNQLADKDFVNSSIATNTANYISNSGSPFTSVAQLEAYSGTVTNNDYAFVTGADSAGNSYYDRYKATVSGSTVTWAKEFRLNNSSFTAAQWAAINSGATAAVIGTVADKESAANKITGITSASTDTQYPSAKAVWTLFSSIAVYDGTVE